MRLSLLSLALGASAGVPESDFYPIIEYWKAGDFRANQLCEGDDAPAEPSSRASKFGFRPSMGLRDFSGQLLQEYASTVQSLSQRDMEYSAKQRRKQNTWRALVDASIRGTIAHDRAMPGAGAFGNEFCSVFEAGAVPPEAFCQAMGNFSRGTGCMSNYQYHDLEAALHEVSPGNNFGYSEPAESCFSLSAGHHALDMPIQRFAQTPMEIDQASGRAEEKVYFALWKAMDKLQRYAEFKYLTAVHQLSGGSERGGGHEEPSISGDIGIHELFVDEEVFAEILPGWQSERVFYINEPRFLGGPTLRTPYALLASRGENLLLVLRRPMTTYESRLALYNQQSFKYLYNFTGEVHDGASTIFQTLSGIVELAVDDFYARRLGGETPMLKKPVLTVVGAELPSSGAAVLIASQLDRVIADRFGANVVDVNAVAFGSGTVSDRLFVEKVRRSIEVRNVVVQGDAADLFPCPKTYSCDERVLPPRTGIETGIEYDYAPLPGRYVIPLHKLARFNSAWDDERAILQLAAIKDCAYSCYLAGQQCPGDVEASKCDPQVCESYILF